MGHDPSSRPEFNGLDLGPHKEVLRSSLIAGDPLTPQEYSVVAERYVDGELAPVTPFFPDRIDGVRFQVTLFGGFRFWIKCDRRPTPAPFSAMQLSPQRSFAVLLSRFKTSKMRESLSVLARKYHALYGDPWGGRQASEIK